MAHMSRSAAARWPSSKTAGATKSIRTTAAVSALLCPPSPARHKGGTGILKIGKTLGIGTGTVRRVVMEQPRPFDVDVADYGVQWISRSTQQWKSVAQNRFGQQPSIEPRRCSPKVVVVKG